VRGLCSGTRILPSSVGVVSRSAFREGYWQDKTTSVAIWDRYGGMFTFFAMWPEAFERLMTQKIKSLSIRVYLVYVLGVINHSDILKMWAVLLHECLVCWVFGDVVIPVFERCELDYEAVREAALQTCLAIVPYSHARWVWEDA
jgi:hypothetical protein